MRLPTACETLIYAGTNASGLITATSCISGMFIALLSPCRSIAGQTNRKDGAAKRRVACRKTASPLRNSFKSSLEERAHQKTLQQCSVLKMVITVHFKRTPFQPFVCVCAKLCKIVFLPCFFDGTANQKLQLMLWANAILASHFPYWPIPSPSQLLFSPLGKRWYLLLCSQWFPQHFR